MSEITLWSDSRFSSPWVLSVWVMLKEKDVAFDVQALNLQKGEHKEGDFQRKSLSGKVPTLQHGDFSLGESLAICEYLEEVFPPPKHRVFFPADLAERAKVREILSWLRTDPDLPEMRRCMPFEGLFESVGQPPVTDKARAAVQRLVQAIRVRLKQPDVLEQPTLADFELAIQMRRPLFYGLELGDASDAVRFSDKLWNRPSVQAWVKLDRAVD